jgi:hypothetical protein
MTTKSKIDYKKLDQQFNDAGASVYHKFSYAIWLLNDCKRGFDQWNNEVFAAHTEDALESLKTLKAAYIKAANERNEKNNASKAIDNASVPTLGVEQMKQMFDQFARMMAAQKNGDLIAAQNAEKGIEQIGNGELQQQGDQATGTNG